MALVKSLEKCEEQQLVSRLEVQGRLSFLLNKPLQQYSHLEVSTGLAYDSGEYEETLTNRATGQKQHFCGQYVMIFRLTSDGHWKIIQHAWTVAPNPA